METRGCSCLSCCFHIRVVLKNLRRGPAVPPLCVGLLVAPVTMRPAVFPRLPSDCPQARRESAAHEALPVLGGQEDVFQ